MVYGILDAVKTASYVIDSFKNGGLSSGDAAGQVAKNFPLITTKGRITKLLSDFVIEPCIITTKGAFNTEVFEKTVQLNTDIFAGFYMQAFQVLSEIYKVDVKTAVTLLSSKFFKTSLESEPIKQYDILMSDKTVKLSDIKFGSVSVESDNKIIKQNDDKDSLIYGTHTRQMMISLNVTCKVMKEDGKEVEEQRIINIPFTIKAHVINTTVENILALVTPVDYKKSFLYRLDEWRAGAISLSDLLFCGDLIKEYKSNVKNDKAKLIELINNRTISSNAKRATNKGGLGVQGFEANYNMLVMTTDELKRLESSIGGSIDNEAKKEKLLSACSALCATILDDDYQRVSLYTADIRGSSSFGYKTLQKRKDNSNDFAEIIKALLVNKPIGI